MGIIRSILLKHKEKIRLRNEKCDILIGKIQLSLSELESIFNDNSNIIEPTIYDVWMKKHFDLFKSASQYSIYSLKKAKNYSILLKYHKLFFIKANALSQRICNHNDMIYNLMIEAAYELIGNIEGRRLDKQQMKCIIKKAHNHLVIAGAGTGKTTTIVGKIKYLLKANICKPEDILVLSFTNSSATEMSERINKETGCKIEASTFHKLGINIITKVNGVAPKISNLNLHKFIKEKLDVYMHAVDYVKLLNSYILNNKIPLKNEFDFKNNSEYEDYLMVNPPTTLKNETLKSYGEVDIANFLFQNNINYIYENPYILDTRTYEYGQYNPDFYLPDYNIYIEYFGINRNGEVPSYFIGSNGKSANETYLDSIEWKRELHKTNGTNLIECYAYEKFENTLINNLTINLSNNQVAVNPKSEHELWNDILKYNNTVLDGIVELFETVINLIKSNNYTIENVKHLIKEKSDKQDNYTILSLVEPLFYAYNNVLIKNGEIDFNDMINLAIQYIREQMYVNNYKYVIVDEYQDISKARYSLLCSLRESSNYDLFCVGDDWQSIYQFAGNDISYIINFKQYWGSTDISKIETTYRFSQKLIEISGNFIMRNPKQIKKSIKGIPSDSRYCLGEINGYSETIAVENMIYKLNDLPIDSTVFFIGRYSFDVNMLKDSKHLTCNYNNSNKLIEVHYKHRPDLRMLYLTAHKSKGLQADYVFIINNKNTRMGFPSKMQDDDILKLLLNDYEQYPYAEERRLFYVALTRAKRKVFLLTIKKRESEFALELKKEYANDIKKEHYECPMCGGQIVKKSGAYGEFWGCTNYQTLGCKYNRKCVRN